MSIKVDTYDIEDLDLLGKVHDLIDDMVYMKRTYIAEELNKALKNSIDRLFNPNNKSDIGKIISSDDLKKVSLANTTVFIYEPISLVKFTSKKQLDGEELYNALKKRYYYKDFELREIGEYENVPVLLINSKKNILIV